MLDLENLNIQRVTVFSIPEDQPSKLPGLPTGGLSLVQLNPQARDMLKKRMVKALGKASHGIEVSIHDTTPQGFFQLGAAALDATDANFLSTAGSFASMLAKAQNNLSLKASKLVVIGGVVTAHARPFIAVVKAELQDALSETGTSNTTSIQHLQNIFMTESQRLYKIGFLQRTVANASNASGIFDIHQHSVHLFDHLMTALETRSAAHYFYSEFLGCQTANSARSRTRDFYNQTLEFIKTSGFSEAKQSDLQEALRAELRSNTAHVSVVDFSQAHMGLPDRAAYSIFMTNKGFPGHAVAKDTEYVKSRLRKRRKIMFTSGVTISTPPDDLQLVTVTANTDGSSTVHIPGTESSRE
ncbi:nucleoid-associated protein [Acidovorax sp.]|uniref:nucleoid-associated protein n=1 Tax=Acidovorax sp. TaxID=1872122 RepID=UPI0040380D40